MRFVVIALAQRLINHAVTSLTLLGALEIVYALRLAKRQEEMECVSTWMTYMVTDTKERKQLSMSKPIPLTESKPQFGQLDSEPHGGRVHIHRNRTTHAISHTQKSTI